ncbi:MAG: hypothetical protein MJ229_00365 [bacterium]|nr:hypothetical protein [bacterium]
MSIASFIKNNLSPSVLLNKAANCNVSNLFIWTTIISNATSCAAQCFGIKKNPQNDDKRKSFLTKQEIAECGLNIASYFIFSKGFEKGAKNLVSSGKVLSKKIVNLAAKNNIDITDFKKVSQSLDGKVTDNLKVLKNDYDCFKQGVGLVGTISGGLLSTTLVVPVLKNTIATQIQKKQDKKALSYDKNPAFSGLNYSSSMKI